MVTRKKLIQRIFRSKMKLHVNINAVVKTYRVPSKSEPGTFHLVQRYGDGRLACDCIAGGMGRECWHKETVRKHELPEV